MSNAPTKGRSRPPLERMIQIHQAIQDGSFPNATRLSGQLEVSTKTIHRDIEFMRDRLQLPIEFSAAENGFHYTEPVTSFPTFQVTEGELFALLVAEKALQQYRGTNFEAPLVSAFKKMAASLPDTVSFNLGDWEKSISFKTSAQQIVDLEVFDALGKATANHERIELLYRKPGGGEPEWRRVDPYHLSNINGEWFLFAWCHLRKDFRTFVPARVREVRTDGTRFKPSKKFDLDRILRDSFGVHSGEGEFEVIVRFDAAVADYIREKQWHPSQRIDEEADGSLKLSLNLSSLAEIQRWIQSWGAHAEVLAPPELRAAVAETAKALAKNYA